MPAKDVIDAINPGPFGSTVTNFAAVEKLGDQPADVAGVSDFTTSDSKKVSGATMFAEGSVGKIRFAGLAYMLEQDGVINLQQNAAEFFASPTVTKYLDKKYPEQRKAMQEKLRHYLPAIPQQQLSPISPLTAAALAISRAINQNYLPNMALNIPARFPNYY